MSTVVGLRDRTLISVMTFAFRIGAVVAMRVEGYCPSGKRWWIRLYEKGASDISCRRTTIWKPISALSYPMNRVDAWRMTQRRAADLGTGQDRMPYLP